MNKQTQEPVAWATEWEDGEWSVSHSPNMGKQSIPLYTHSAPSQQPVSLGDFDRRTKTECVEYIDYLRKALDLVEFKKWQGLSDNEINFYCGMKGNNHIDFAHAIEQALKEKNTL